MHCTKLHCVANDNSHAVVLCTVIVLICIASALDVAAAAAVADAWMDRPNAACHLSCADPVPSLHKRSQWAVCMHASF